MNDDGTGAGWPPPGPAAAAAAGPSSSPRRPPLEVGARWLLARQPGAAAAAAAAAAAGCAQRWLAIDGQRAVGARCGLETLAARVQGYSTRRGGGAECDQPGFVDVAGQWLSCKRGVSPAAERWRVAIL
eukprot:scaffold5678_cov394-Prasinococcus_capsulatus_cf.AAC.6